MANNIEKLQAQLETEKKEILADLEKVGRPNLDHSGDWEVKPVEEDETEFRDEVADQLESMEERGATEKTLENRLRNIDRALEKIATKTYGLCEICDQPIESERLEANPAARTCKIHINEEDYLKA